MQRNRSILADKIIEFPQFNTGTTEQNIKSFLNHLAKPIVWGGIEIILATSDIYGCEIRTIWENGGTSKVASIRNAGVAPITIVHRKGGTGWNHYDSFLCDTSISFSSNSNDKSTCADNGSQYVDLVSTVDGTDDIASCGISTQNLNSTPIVPVSITSHQSSWPNLRVGTWNVRGCNNYEKRKKMDEYLSITRFDVVAIQETSFLTTQSK